jgi:hypothetical protein
MHRRVPSARCSATHTCSGTRDLAGRLVLPSDRPAALLGFVVADCLSFAGLIPHGGWRPCYHGSGPTCRFAFLSAPIYFRRGVTRASARCRFETLASVRSRAKDVNRGRSCDRLLGFAPVCGPRRRHGRFFTGGSCR